MNNSDKFLITPEEISTICEGHQTTKDVPQPTHFVDLPRLLATMRPSNG